MATDKQIEANRLNALKSTGLHTEAGRNRTRLNAVKHGLTGHLDVMTDDERQAHDLFVAGIVDSFRPADPLEQQLANSVAEGYWRLNRAAALEINFFAAGIRSRDGDTTDESTQPEEAQSPDSPSCAATIDRALARAATFLDNPTSFHLLGVYEMRLHRKVKSDLQPRDIQATRRDAEERKAEQEKAVERRVLEESLALLELKLQRDKRLDLDSSFTHPNGSVFSTRKLVRAMKDNRRIQTAKNNVACNAFPLSRLESMFPESRTQ